VLILLLDEMVVLVAIFLLLNFLDIRIPLSVSIVVGLLIFVFVGVIHVKVIPSFHLKKVTGREGMIGLTGMVVQPLKPVGTVYVRGENWKAETDGDYIETGEDVEIVGIKELLLKVTRPVGGTKSE
jgi:membrane-bound serine protease (ClpP class)